MAGRGNNGPYEMPKHPERAAFSAEYHITVHEGFYFVNETAYNYYGRVAWRQRRLLGMMEEIC